MARRNMHRAHNINIRLDDEEHEILTTAADHLKLSISETVRVVMKTYVNKNICRPPRLADVLDMKAGKRSKKGGR